MIRTALRLEARGNKNPADVLCRVNRFVTDDMKRGMFVTMFYLVLDSRNRIIHYASAGHNPMILNRGNNKQTYFLNPSGFPVGIQLPDISLFERKISKRNHTTIDERLWFRKHDASSKGGKNCGECRRGRSAR